MLTRPNAYCLLAALSAAAVLAVASAASAQSSVSLDWEVIGYPTGDDQVNCCVWHRMAWGTLRPLMPGMSRTATAHSCGIAVVAGCCLQTLRGLV